jgi:Gas vesicle synthesis protein GvpL/GvpF
VSPTYVYGVVPAETVLPEGLRGLGPSGTVSLVADGRIAAIVGDVPLERPLGTREDLIAHESVVDAVAGTTTILPMRFPAVVEEEGVINELLGPNEEFFLRALADLEGRVQYILKGRYEQDVVLREVLEDDEELRALQEHVRGLPEDASYYDRVKLGELIVAAIEQRREVDATELYERLDAMAVAVAPHQPAQPEDVIDAALLIERADIDAFGDAVEDLGEAWAGRIRFRLLGPLAPYDFVSSEAAETGA